MIVRELPTTFFGENLKSGVFRIAEYCMVESVCLLLIFTLCCMTDLIEAWHTPAYYDLIPIALFIVSLLKVFANVLLHKGTTQGRSDFLRFWIYVYGVNTVTMILFMLGTGITIAILFPPKINAYIAGGQCMVFIMYCGMFKYFCQVVYAHKCQLEQGRDSMRIPIVDEA